MAATLAALPPLDTTLAVRPDTRLEVSLASGVVRVGTWNRDAVRLVADARGRVNVGLRGAVLRVAGANTTVATLEITVPRRMALSLGEGDVDVSVRGTSGEVIVSTHAGRIEVDGGQGVITLTSSLGEIILRNARGRVSARSTHNSVTLSNVSGDIEAGSTDKHVTLTRVDSRNVRATTVGGVVRFSGSFHTTGRYVFSTHAGAVWATVPLPVHATVSVATINGAFSTDIPHTITDRQRRGSFTVLLGSGSAQVLMESFSGAIVLKKAEP